MTRKQAIIKGTLFIFVILSISILLIHLQNQIGPDRIRAYVSQAGPIGPVIFVFLVLFTHIFAPIQGTPFVILGIAMFGKWSIIYLYITTLVSSFTNFWIARKLGRDIVVKLVGQQALLKIDHIAAHEGVKALIFMRLFQGFITDFVSYAAGLTSIKFGTYYIVSVIAPIPWTILMFLFFDKIPLVQVFPALLVVGSILFIIPPVYYFLRHRFTKNKVIHLPL